MTSIYVDYDPNSLERFEQGGNVLKILGKGRMKTPGHPAGNQQYSSQAPFVRAASLQKLFPVYYRMKSVLAYMGEYSLQSMTKKESFEGFTYFLFTLHRRSSPPLEPCKPCTLTSHTTVPVPQ
jgi:hypothetical protein